MYLYYYLDGKLVGTVDIEVYFLVKGAKSLVACSPECRDLLAAWELMYGKKIESFSLSKVYGAKHNAVGNYIWTRPGMQVFTTKRCGKVLQWDDKSKELVCN